MSSISSVHTTLQGRLLMCVLPVGWEAYAGT